MCAFRYKNRATFNALKDERDKVLGMVQILHIGLTNDILSARSSTRTR